MTRIRRTLSRVVPLLLVGAVTTLAFMQLRPDATGTDAAGPGSRDDRDLRMIVEFPPARRGDPVRIEGTDLTGRPLSLHPGAQRATVVNVWGSWCPPCRAEAPVLAEAARKFEGKVRFIGVNVRDNPAAARAFEDRFRIPYPSVDDSQGRAVLALNDYVSANAVPATLVLDGRGRVAARVLGEIRAATLRALLASVLDRPGPA